MSPTSNAAEATALPPAPLLRGRTAVAGLAGVALCAAIAAVAHAIGQHESIQASGIGPLVIAMAIGMAIGNTVYGRIASACTPGVALSKQTLLRMGIVLYGMRLTLHDMAQIGLAGIMIDVAVVASTFFLALLIGIKVLKLDRDTVLLIGAGSSICGAAAVLATGPVVNGRTDRVTVAVSTVVIFGTLATFLYPLLYHLQEVWPVLPQSAGAFGVYAGSTIHEVAQVVAAARSADAAAVDTAVIAKMARVMMLFPFLVGLALCIARPERDGISGSSSGTLLRDAAAFARSLPWFAFGFALVVVLNSLLPLPPAIAGGTKGVDTLLLTMAMAALGLTTHVSAFRRAGIKPIVLGALLFAWLIAGGAWINHIVPGVLNRSFVE